MQACRMMANGRETSIVASSDHDSGTSGHGIDDEEEEADRDYDTEGTTDSLLTPRGVLPRRYRICDKGGRGSGTDDKTKEEKEEGIAGDDKEEKKLASAEDKCDDGAEQRKDGNILIRSLMATPKGLART